MHLPACRPSHLWDNATRRRQPCKGMGALPPPAPLPSTLVWRASKTERVGYVGVPITYSMKATAVGSQNLQIMWNEQDEYRPQVSADPCVGKRENHAGFRADRL